MADKPSNSRKKVSFQPARDGQAARWSIEGEAAGGEDKGAAKQRAPRNQRERAQARVDERKRAKASRPVAKAGTARDTASARARRQHGIVEANERALGDRTAAAVRRSKSAPERGARGERSRDRAASPAAASASSSAKSSPRAPRAAAAPSAARSNRAAAAAPDRERVRIQAEAERVVADNPQRARHATTERTRNQVAAAMMPSSSSSSGGGHSTVFGLPMRTVLIVALVAVIAVFFVWHPWSQGTDAAAPAVDPGEQAPVSDILEERFTTMPTYGIVAPVDFNAVEEEGFTAGFVLAHGGVVTDYSLYDTEPELSDDSAQQLNEALAPFTENDAVPAFLLMDIQTGRGFARNVDKTIYGASSFKGPYCAYLLKKYVDGGSTELTDSFSSGYMNSALAYVRSGTDTLDDLIADTIVNSSNDAFASLRVNFSDATLADWLTSVDVDSQVAYDTWFPFNTVRNMAKLWMETYYFLQSNSDAANTLKEYMGSTETSFMREALTGVRKLEDETILVEAADDGEVSVEAADGAGDEAVAEATDGEIEVAEAAAEDGETLEETSTLKVTGSVGKNLGNVMEHSINVIMAPEITVLDKAGWNIDYDDNYDTLVDCGIVTCNGRDYLLCVMADVAYTDANVEDFERLIAAVFNARQDLA